MSSHHSNTNQNYARGSISGKNLIISIILNILITVSQIIGGFLSGSLALLSDAIHNFSDVISLIISYIANILTNKKKQTIQQTFGFKRAEIIAAFINSAWLIIIAVLLVIEAVKRFYSPQHINSTLVIWLSVVAIFANGISVLLLKKDADHNMNMKSAYLHLFSDMLTSIAVLIGGLLIRYYDILWVDAALTLLISIYLIYMSWDILLNSLKILMLFAPENISIKEVITTVSNISSIKNVHHVHIWQLNDHECHFEAHLELKENIQLSEFDTICKQIEKILKKSFNISHTYLQPEFNREESKEVIIQD